jgi:hypothetical protein
MPVERRFVLLDRFVAQQKKRPTIFHFGIGHQHADPAQPAPELVTNPQRAPVKLGLANVHDHAGDLTTLKTFSHSEEC